MWILAFERVGLCPPPNKIAFDKRFATESVDELGP
jgi:hypothetical protein